VDLTAYVEKHEFCFDAVLDERVTNDEVMFCMSGIKVEM
jgi:kinesin family protein 2/24